MLFDYVKNEKLGQFVEFDSFKIKEPNDLLSLSVQMGNAGSNDNKSGYVSIPFVVIYNGDEVKAAATISVKKYVAGETIKDNFEREPALKETYRKLLEDIAHSNWYSRVVLQKGENGFKKNNKYCTGTYRGVDWSIIRVYFPRPIKPLTEFTDFESVK